MRNQSGIYEIVSGKGDRYIGSAVNLRRRWREHRNSLKAGTHKNFKLQNGWDKYGEEFFTFRIMLVCEPSDLLMYEQRAIDFCRPRYNVCLVAGSALGVKRSAETRQRMSARLLGKPQSAAMRAARSAGLVGHPVSDETRLKLAAQKGWKHSDDAKAKMRGRFVSEEQRKRMSASRTGKVGPWAGKPRPEDTKAKISAALKGRPLSPETRAKMSEARKRKSGHMLNSVDFDVKT